MSYILDALRRADAERDSGRVPGIHSQVAFGRAAAVRTKARTGRAALWWGAGASLLALAALAWWAMGSRPAGPENSGASPPSSQPLPAVQIAAAPAPPAPAVPEAPGPVARPTAPVEPILAPPRPQPAASVSADPPPPTSPPPQAPPAAVRAAPGTAPPAPADAAVPRLDDLPAAQRAQWPTLQVSGSTYSGNAALRMLIVNGRVVQEGQDIAPGLRLETIAPRDAIVNYQGQRARIAH